MKTWKAVLLCLAVGGAVALSTWFVSDIGPVFGNSEPEIIWGPSGGSISYVDTGKEIPVDFGFGTDGLVYWRLGNVVEEVK